MRENVREGYVAPRLFCFCFFSPFPVLAQQLPCHGDDDACTGHDTLARQHRPSEAAETGIFSTLSLTTSPQDVICPLHGTTKRASERRKTCDDGDVTMVQVSRSTTFFLVLSHSFPALFYAQVDAVR